MRWLVLFFGVAAAALSGAALSSHAQTPQREPTELARQAVDAMNGGDVDALLALFSSDGTIEGFPYCQVPCTGRLQIGEELEVIVAANVHVTVTSEDVVGNTVTVRFEATSDALHVWQIDRVVGTFTVIVEGDRIASARFELDPNDAETAQALAMLQDIFQGDSPQALSPALPETGDGAEVASSPGWSLTVGILSAIGAGAIALAIGANVLASIRRD